MKSSKLVDMMVEILEAKKAREVEVIDISGVSVLSDYFVICSGTSTTHIKTLADELEFKMKEAGYPCLHQEGYDTARWILLEFNEAIVHIFHEEDRSFYNLERLWTDGKFRKKDLKLNNVISNINQ